MPRLADSFDASVVVVQGSFGEVLVDSGAAAALKQVASP